MKWSRSFVASLLRDRGIRPKRRLGQNFLVDDDFLRAIVRRAGVDREDGVIEIGSGIGNLTDHLAARAGRVWAFEIDGALHEISRELVGGLPNVVLVRADGAEFGRHVDAAGFRRLKVVSNLPYSGYRRLLLSLLSSPAVASYTLMVQRDVYERLRARHGTKEYGPLSVLLQSACSMRRLRDVDRRLFHPVPRVESVLFGVERRQQADFEAIDEVLRSMFAHRRKKFGRWLREHGIEDDRLADKRVEEVPAGTLFSLVLGKLP